MKILYIGDIMALPGQTAVTKILPKIKKEYKPDFIIAQAENIDREGKGPGLKDIQVMQKAGIDFFTGGNHSLRGSGSAELYKDESIPAVRPANLKEAPGNGWKIIDTDFGRVLIISILGQTVGRPLNITNPLEKIDEILKITAKENIAARIVNLHGDFSSEKKVFGYYLDGKVSAVVGDHWHIPTADAMVLPKGTAHITDVGMCGALHSSLGVKSQVIIDRWKTKKPSKNIIEENGPLQFNGVIITIDTNSGLAAAIELIQRII